jgi:acetoin utilization protein AcuB
MRLELVRDWMSHDVVSVTPDTLLPEAEKLLINHTIRRLPVVEDGRLVGIITYGDIREARPGKPGSFNLWALGSTMAQLCVSEIMTADPVTVSPDDTIGEAAQLMLNHMISGLPVVNHQGELVGIITESDIFRLVVRNWATLDERVEPYARYP